LAVRLVLGLGERCASPRHGMAEGFIDVVESEAQLDVERW
jgi:hypothetical protein